MDSDGQEQFVDELKSVNFQIALDIFKKREIESDGAKVHGDIFLMEQIFPVLLDGLERLSKEVEQYLFNSESIDVEVRRRFNPCIFLAQFLMRNNPKFNPDKKNEAQYKQILQYVRSEKFNRFFESKKKEFLKNFYKSTGKDKPECEISDMRAFVKQVDEQTKQDGKLNEYFLNNKNIARKRKEITFDAIIAEIVRYCAQNDSVTVDQFRKYLA